MLIDLGRSGAILVTLQQFLGDGNEGADFG